jgi:hypothetical protein
MTCADFLACLIREAAREYLHSKGGPPEMPGTIEGPAHLADAAVTVVDTIPWWQEAEPGREADGGTL